jgi:hypothetical protein
MLREQEVDRMSEASSEKGKNRYWFPAKRYGWGWGSASHFAAIDVDAEMRSCARI